LNYNHAFNNLATILNTRNIKSTAKTSQETPDTKAL
jgi:hypothetical protein